MANKMKYQSKLSMKKMIFVAVILVMVSVTLYFANFLIQEKQTLTVGATTGNANLFLEPPILTLPPDGQVNLWVTTDKPLGFVATELSFDPTLLRLSAEIVLPNTALTQVIKLTPMAEANTTGKINIVIAVKPTTLTIAPTGNFSLASLKFANKTTLTNKATVLNISTSTRQLVDLGAVPFIVTSQNANITLNPVGATPTPTLTPMPSSTPDGIDLAGPILTLTSGTYLTGTYYVTAKASDVSGIATITMTVDGKVVRTCSNKPSCRYYPSRTLIRPFDVVVVAMDGSTQKNVTSATITVK